MTSAAAVERSGIRSAAGLITLVLCFCTTFIEGIDLQSMGIAAPKLGPEFHLGPHDLGNVLMASPLGLFFGAFIGGRLADAFGRKAALILSMAVFGLFQLSTVWAPGYEPLVAIRFACGLGLGGALPNLIALTSEALGGKNSILNVVITAAGMPTGGALASFIAFQGGETGDWRTVFYIGGIAPLLLAPVMALALPESRLFREAKAQAAEAGRRANTLKVLFGEGRATASILLWLGFFGTTLVTYLLLNWLPKLLVNGGFTKTDASFIQIFFNVGSAIGSIFLGWLMQRKPRRMILFVCYAGVALFLYGLTFVGHSVVLASWVVAIIGMFLLGAQYILYGLSPLFYRTESRGTGAGAAVAAGRLGSAAAPQLGGVLVAAGASFGQVMESLLPVTAVSAAAAILLMFCKRSQH
jgi:MFS transporter, AAHS family, 3-hydroxyphenylpropionic acid transporter